jgi:uncharacterized SAM-binding protein YcdF (DUF218 family)
VADDVDLGRLVTDLPDWEERDDQIRPRRRRAPTEDEGRGPEADDRGQQAGDADGAAGRESSDPGRRESPGDGRPTGPDSRPDTGSGPVGSGPATEGADLPTGDDGPPAPAGDERTTPGPVTDPAVGAEAVAGPVARPDDPTPPIGQPVHRVDLEATDRTARSNVDVDTAPMEPVVARTQPAGPTTGRRAVAEAPTRRQHRVEPPPAPVAEPWEEEWHDEPVRRRRRRRSVWRRLLLAFVLLVLLLVGYYAFTLWQVWSTGRSDEARPVDAIVVMGAAQYDGRPSPQLAARLDHVAELWPAGYAPIVVATGGNQPGDRFTEAEASAAYLAERGVPVSAIVQEDQGATTLESLENVADLLEARGAGSVLIVTDPYHALRSRMIAEDHGLDAYVSPTGTSVVSGRESVTRHLEEAAGVSVGRLIGFDRLSGLTG